ncbi:MAG TPA: NUDIX hydrolase [Actinomycetota bacterium]|nr:NUDIX hydrolase [Actinomycetota bacterium]
MTREAAEAGSPVVRAGGGVVVDAEGRVAVVHRPKYDDWTLPKGKLFDGEEPLAGALREVEEETGHRCIAVESLGALEYTDRQGRTKVVDYWLMEPVDGAFSPGDEVDETRWLLHAEAEELLTFGRDADIVKRGLRAWAQRRT